MKMISRTRKTSVSGVMLISATTPSSPCLVVARPERGGHGDLRAAAVRRGGGGLDVEQRLHEALAGARVGRGDRADARSAGSCRRAARGSRRARPAAVATSASEMPAATTSKPPAPCTAMSWKARMMPTTVPNRPMYGASEPIVPSIQRPRLQLGARLLARGRRARARDPRARCSSSASPRGRSPRSACFAFSHSERARREIAPHQALDRVARELARAAVDAAEAPEPLDQDREHEDRAHRERVDGEAALLQELRTLRVQRSPSRPRRPAAADRDATRAGRWLRGLVAMPEAPDACRSPARQRVDTPGRLSYSVPTWGGTSFGQPFVGPTRSH